MANADRLLLSGVNAGNGFLTLDLLPTPVTTVPEPDSLGLAGAGLVALLFVRRKARRG